MKIGVSSDRDLDRRIALLAPPAPGSIAAEPAYSLADTAIVGHLGRTQLGFLAIATAALTMTAWLGRRHVPLPREQQRSYETKKGEKRTGPDPF